MLHFDMYATTRFRVDDTAAHADILSLTQKSDFAIITACAPTGETWRDDKTAVEDSKLHQRLLSTLKEHGVDSKPIRITGYGTNGHAEQSWAVALPLDVAEDLGTEFLQIAIFYIKLNQEKSLGVYFCKPYKGVVGYTDVEGVASFLERLDDV